MKHIKGLNVPAKWLLNEPSAGARRIIARAPLPRECSSTYAPGMEVGPDGNTGKNLCNPFLRDTAICSGSYWPAQRPDGSVYQTGQSWMAACADLQNDWDKVPVVIPKSGPATGTLWDTADKSDLANLCDVYLRDNWNDTGAPHTGVWWESPDIFFRRLREDPAGFANTSIDYHQNPVRGAENWLYGRIINRGPQQEIDHVFVRFYICEPWASNPNWRLIGHATTANVAAGGVRVVRSVKPYVPGVLGHACLMATLDSTQDPLQVVSWANYDPSKGPQPGDLKVLNQENNGAQRNITVVRLIPFWHRLWEWISLGNVLWAQGIAMMRLEIAAVLPRGARIVLGFPDVPAAVLRTVKLGAGSKFVELPDGTAGIAIATPRRAVLSRFPVRWPAEGPRRGDLERIVGTDSADMERLRGLGVTDLKHLVEGRRPTLANRVGVPPDRAEAWMAQARRLLETGQRPLWMKVQVQLPPRAIPGMDHPIVVRQYGDDRLLGGVTIVARTMHPEWVRYVASVRQRVVHWTGCSAVQRIEDADRQPFDVLEAAINDGYEPHEECTRR